MELSATDVILVKEFLESEHDRFNRMDFIEHDPISIPHRYQRKEDREISGFLTATISWGQRQTILKNASQLMLLMDDAPYDFLMGCKPADLKRFGVFVHRTFNGSDCMLFIRLLIKLYREKGGLHHAFTKALTVSNNDMSAAIHHLRITFFDDMLPNRAAKHFSDPLKNSAAKRFCMFLRWMVRQDQRGVDFGIWQDVPMRVLRCPLDVHSGRVARELGILRRTQNDWQSVEELYENLLYFDDIDPCKYDFALFGGGVQEKKTSP